MKKRIMCEEIRMKNIGIVTPLGYICTLVNNWDGMALRKRYVSQSGTTREQIEMLRAASHYMQETALTIIR